MTGYEAESYDNGSRFAAAVVRGYGLRAAAQEVASFVAGDMTGPAQAWATGALDTLIALATAKENA